MKKLVCYLVLLLVIGNATAQRVSLQFDKSLPQAVYAADVLKKTLIKRGYILNDLQPDYSIVLAVNGTTLGKEAFLISPEAKKINVHGGDGTGVMYGALSICEDIRNCILIHQQRNKNESPRLPFREIKYDLPWH